eukprot:SAG11_NODE_689_length_7713_cov_3.470055_7_plen_204_part_00
MMQMQQQCGVARAQGMFQCARCTTRRTNATACGEAVQQSFCAGEGCVPKLADSCGNGNSNASCFDCAGCAAARHNATGCRASDEDAFCRTISAPLAPTKPSCDALLARYCNASLHAGTFQCIQCSGEHSANLSSCNQSFQTFRDPNFLLPADVLRGAGDGVRPHAGAVRGVRALLKERVEVRRRRAPRVLQRERVGALAATCT